MSEEKNFFYANAVEATLSAYDVSFKFMRTGTANQKAIAAQVGQPLQNAQIELQESFTIAMSPQHAKAMLPVLAELVKRYEEQFGQLPDSDKIKAGISPVSNKH